MNTKVISNTVQKIMDSNKNICFNCTYFKMVWNKHGSVIPKDIEQYKALQARCTHYPAIEENANRGNLTCLRGFLRGNTKFAKAR